MSWITVQYMIAEVQYGGKVTQGLDRRLLVLYAQEWLKEEALQDGFSYSPERPITRLPRGFEYVVLGADSIEEYHKFCASLPDVDSPEIFGLHPNADLTFRVREASSLLHALEGTQPKGGGGGG